MNFIKHPEQMLIEIGDGFSGGLFAMPLLLNPSLVKPNTDPLNDLNYVAAGAVLNSSGIVSHNRQNVAFLARAVDARFIAGARGDNQKNVLKTIVAMHQSKTRKTACTDLLNVGGFDPAGGGLAFLIGAVYRSFDDPEDVVLPDQNDFLLSRARMELEVALSGPGSTHYRHQILAPVDLASAIGVGVRAAMNCWTAMIRAPIRCDFNLDLEGDVTMQLSHGGDVGVSLGLGLANMSGHDVDAIHAATMSCAANSPAPVNSCSSFLH